MDVLLLSRLQFAFATFIHFIFVPLTLGLSFIVAVMETKYVRTGDETYKKMAKFWGRLFLINFALGVVTGITLEFQFGTNWSRYSTYVGDIFGSLLAIEATAAFFLESTFIAVWVFGWKKLSPKFHATCIWIVAFAANLSALWIILANGFMQHPVGYVIQNGRAELASFTDVVTNGYAWNEFFHTVTGAWALGGFFVVGVSAWHLLRKQNVDFFTKSFRIGAAFALIFALAVALVGHRQGNIVAEAQPAKLAAMESHWETQANAPMYLVQVPDPENEGNSVQFGKIPSILSIMAFNNPSAVVKGLKDFPKQDRPPVTLTFTAFRLMVGLGTLMIIVAILAFIARHQPAESSTKLLKLFVWCIPVPYLALQAGWAVAEVGRQPWIVYGLMRTKDAVSPLATSQVAISLVAFFVVYILLAVIDIFLLAKYARKQPA
ncbi:cytochrome bd ubiquinol oxidase subunit I [Solidesulfovibrio fructosivorans JJ]]|uniref:Cytochrome bd ubiquinol oxidase subunit I n=1 Tax=Solidesulfovibrio fructosivorans JJ] TaxID=596151 RepID=E1JU13_SOLFR|nr:cytochrome ubiquinol oxidase subunit I [Solidesulfovibrio fructosivorans]EFL52292.1 cytochrome bd ubiquinol oxidase subunit I [Solidesulfovibrio fructosivorans JJ]]